MLQVTLLPEIVPYRGQWTSEKNLWGQSAATRGECGELLPSFSVSGNAFAQQKILIELPGIADNPQDKISQNSVQAFQFSRTVY